MPSRKDKVRQARVRVLKDNGELRIAIRGERDLPVVLFLGVWLVTMAGFTKAFLPEVWASCRDLRDLPLLVPAISFWVSGWLFFFGKFLSLLSGSQLVILDATTLTVIDAVWPFAARRRFSLAEIGGVRVDEDEDSVAFDYGVETHYFGVGLSGKDLTSLVGRVATRVTKARAELQGEPPQKLPEEPAPRITIAEDENGLRVVIRAPRSWSTISGTPVALTGLVLGEIAPPWVFMQECYPLGVRIFFGVWWVFWTVGWIKIAMVWPWLETITVDADVLTQTVRTWLYRRRRRFPLAEMRSLRVVRDADGTSIILKANTGSTDLGFALSDSEAKHIARRLNSFIASKEPS